MAEQVWFSPRDKFPTDGQRVAWVDGMGKESKGTFSRGLWFLDGSGIYIYYVPTLWRALGDDEL